MYRNLTTPHDIWRRALRLSARQPIGWDARSVARSSSAGHWLRGFGRCATFRLRGASSCPLCWTPCRSVPLRAALAGTSQQRLLANRPPLLPGWDVTELRRKGATRSHLEPNRSGLIRVQPWVFTGATGTITGKRSGAVRVTVCARVSVCACKAQ